MGLLVGSSFSFPDVTVQSLTFHSIGMVVDLASGADSNHDGSISVRYRKVGDGWSLGFSLIRNDWTNEDSVVYNNFAGSIFFLTPGTTYDIELTYTDPDSSPTTGTSSFQATTRAIPSKPTGGTTYYCIEGGGSGIGSDADPFQGLDEADANVSAGDIVLLRDTGGKFTKGTLTTFGTDDNWIVYEPDTGHSPVLFQVSLGVDYVWLSGLTLTGDATTDDEADAFPINSGIYVPSSQTVTRAIIEGCTISGFVRPINNFHQGEQWVVMDNDITGIKPVNIGTTGTPGDSTGRGIFPGSGNADSGHIIAYNDVRQCADAINSSNGGQDIYANQLDDHEDDLISTDGAGANLRVWGNRCHHAAGFAFSFQPQEAGPWYLLYNQFAPENSNEWAKWRWPDRVVLINNTIISHTSRAQHLLWWFSRNNLFIRDAAFVWTARDTGAANERPPTWEAVWGTDVDYDGLDDGGNTPIIRWYDDNGQTNERQAPEDRTDYNTLAAFASALGIETNGVEVDADLIFDNYTIDADNSLELAAGGNAAVDVGDPVDNLADFYVGSAPDLGAHERGATALFYGVRTSELSLDLDQRTNHWIKH